ncbi:hypothetical protein ATO8_18140 [Roseivivax marinus]|uniref:Uncharacterized protein n=1 Tax=Roseivivax marinus TaxID=1379903 RepID=W4HGX2_9RHOB|nr:hypothetical protein [Roseivivax marinus]ETW11250.1 hypothetical protein ATO8_18140 [Roseivivax marinus]UMA67328.1 hypothetical protein LVO79_21670 [Roseivivax marinus]
MSMQPDTCDVAHIDTRLLWDPHTQLAFKAHYFGRLTCTDATAAEAGRLIERVEAPKDGEGGVFRLSEKGHELLELPEDAWEETAILTITGMLFARSREYLEPKEAADEVFWTRAADDQVHEDLIRAFEEARDYWRRKEKDRVQA